MFSRLDEASTMFQQLEKLFFMQILTDLWLLKWAICFYRGLEIGRNVTRVPILLMSTKCVNQEDWTALNWITLNADNGIRKCSFILIVLFIHCVSHSTPIQLKDTSHWTTWIVDHSVAGQVKEIGVTFAKFRPFREFPDSISLFYDVCHGCFFQPSSPIQVGPD